MEVLDGKLEVNHSIKTSNTCFSHTSQKALFLQHCRQVRLKPLALVGGLKPFQKIFAGHDLVILDHHPLVMA
jgi:hypothetical protein